MGRSKHKKGGDAGNFYEAVYTLVRTIPKGRVMTYGQIATILGAPRAARAVGYAMRASGRHEDVPWQRVINSQGAISARSEVSRPIIQEQLLKKEGVKFDESGVCDLEVYRWEPSGPSAFFYEPSSPNISPVFVAIRWRRLL